MTNSKKCGKEHSQGEQFCAQCGTPVHSEKQIFSGKKEVEPESQLSRISRKKRPHGRRNHTRKWLIGAGALFVLLLAAMAGFFLLNDGDKDQASTAGQEETEVEPPKMTQSDVSALFPGWKMIQQEMICLKGAYYHVLAVAKNEGESGGTVKIATVDYDGKSEDNEWEIVWESEEYTADPIVNMENYIHEFHVLNPENASKALVGFNIFHAGTARTYATSVISIDQKGLGTEIWEGNGSTLGKKDDYIEVMVLGAVRFNIEEDIVKITEIPRSEVGSADALKVEFILDADGLVAPADDEEIHVKVGQPFTFIPVDQKTKTLFDEGEIYIYFSSMELGSVAAANANLIYAGNEFVFTEEGSYGFLLHYPEGNPYTPPYTFIVHVGDGDGSGERPAVNEEAADGASASEKIEAPFPIGTPLSELKAKYGEPSFDDYYEGARLVVFDKEGYILDWNERVNGYYFAAPTISVFGAKIGMTGEEINKIYGENVEPAPDEKGTSDRYIHFYHKNGYKIIFYSKEKHTPTTEVMIVKE